jgi:hypothetical protein
MSTPFHRLLFDLVPPFRAIRAPIRWAMVADLGFALLAGVTAAALVQAWSRRRSRTFGFGIAACLCGALLFEDCEAPMYLNRGEPDPDPLTRFLKETPMAGGLWELPDEFGEANAHHVLRAADHWKPLVNGYSRRASRRTGCSMFAASCPTTSCTRSSRRSRARSRSKALL